MLGFGGATAAAAFDWHSPWADDAAAEVTYTLPSGAVCTGIIGNFKGEDEAVAAAEAFMGQPTLIETLDIDGLNWEGEERCPGSILPAWLSELDATHGE